MVVIASGLKINGQTDVLCYKYIYTPNLNPTKYQYAPNLNPTMYQPSVNWVGNVYPNPKPIEKARISLGSGIGMVPH